MTSPTIAFPIEWLATTTLDEAAIAANPDLARMLDEFRTIEPMPFKCSATRCNRTIVYWALSSSDARVIFAPQRRKKTEHRKGRYRTEPDPHPLTHVEHPDEVIVSSEADLIWPGLVPSGRFPEHIEWAMGAGSNVELITNPGVASGYPLRYLFRCPNPICPAVYRYTNRLMLQEFLMALALGKREIRPGRM